MTRIKDSPLYKSGPVTSFGWMKREELSNSWTDTWESPEGVLHRYLKGVTPWLVVFTPLLEALKNEPRE